jgi:hypothetical protein
MAKKYIENKPVGEVNAERSKLRWLENMENALGELEGDKWKQKANNRTSVVKDAKVFRAKE